jgi:uncharacterized protein YigE (DUF2233 family)
MKQLGILIIAAFLVVGLTFLSLEEPQPVAASPGIEYLTVKVGAFGLRRIRVIRFALSDIELRLLYPGEGESLARVEKMRGCGQALVCVNGPFFETDSMPPKALGLMVSEGVMLQPLRDVNWGVFRISKDGLKATIVPRRRFLKDDDIQSLGFALQSGPTILRDGRITQPALSDRARRTAIGLDSKNRVVLLIVNFPISLPAMARVAMDELEIVDLMNLDGGSSTQMVVRQQNDTYRVLGFPVAVGIGLYPRTKSRTNGGGEPSPASKK